jgi:hypothetical protein
MRKIYPMQPIEVKPLAGAAGIGDNVARCYWAKGKALWVADIYDAATGETRSVEADSFYSLKMTLAITQAERKTA